MRAYGSPGRGLVVGFDGLSPSRFAVRWAAAEATRRECPLYLVRVVGVDVPVALGGWSSGPSFGDGRRRAAEDELSAEVESCRSAYAWLEVHASLYEGSLYGRLSAHASRVGADVFVVGAPGQGRRTRTVFGSAAAGLVRATRQPVVAVRRPSPVHEALTVTGYAPVVAVCDDAVTSARVLGFAFDTATSWRTDVVVVVAPPRPRGAVRAPRGVPRRVFGRQLAGCRARHPEVPVRVETAEDQLSTVLSHAGEARLVVVGDRRQGGAAERLLTGSMSHMVLHDADCTVAVV